MPSGSIGNPASDNVPFPAVITGTYDISSVIIPKCDPPTFPPPPPPACTIPVNLTVTVTVTRESDGGYSSGGNAALTCSSNTAGAWSFMSPNDLVVGATDYIITATIGHNGSMSYTRSGIST